MDDGPARTPSGRRDGIISLVCGIVGLIFFPIIFGIVAIIFGIRSRRSGGGVLATVGLILGAVDIALFIIALTAWSSNALAWY